MRRDFELTYDKGNAEDGQRNASGDTCDFWNEGFHNGDVGSSNQIEALPSIEMWWSTGQVTVQIVEIECTAWTWARTISLITWLLDQIFATRFSIIHIRQDVLLKVNLFIYSN